MRKNHFLLLAPKEGPGNLCTFLGHKQFRSVFLHIFIQKVLYKDISQSSFIVVFFWTSSSKKYTTGAFYCCRWAYSPEPRHPKRMVQWHLNDQLILGVILILLCEWEGQGVTLSRPQCEWTFRGRLGSDGNLAVRPWQVEVYVPWDLGFGFSGAHCLWISS